MKWRKVSVLSLKKWVATVALVCSPVAVTYANDKPFSMSCSTLGFSAVVEGVSGKDWMGQSYSIIQRYKITRTPGQKGGDRAYLYSSMAQAPNNTSYLEMIETGPLKQDGQWSNLQVSQTQYLRKPEMSMRVNFDDSGRNTKCLMKKLL